MRTVVHNADVLQPETREALEVLTSRINQVFQTEHNGDGTHTDITADSVTIAGDLTVGDNVAVTDDVVVGGSIVAGGAVIAQSVTTTTGSVTSAGNLYERGRTPAIGEWTTVTYDAANFTASAGTWTVDSADQVTFQSMRIGKTMWVAFVINQTDVSNAGVSLKITLPNGATAAKTTRQYIRVIDAGAAGAAGMALITAGTTFIECFSSPAAAGFAITAADNTNVAGVVVIEVQ